MSRTPSRKVSPKVTAASVASALTVVLLYVLEKVPGVGDLPARVEDGVSVLVLAGVVFAAGYLVPDPDRDGPAR